MQDPAIEALYTAWEKAFREADVETIQNLVTPDYLLFAPGAQPVGIEALLPRLAAVFAAYTIELGFESEERIAAPTGYGASRAGSLSRNRRARRPARAAAGRNRGRLRHSPAASTPFP